MATYVACSKCERTLEYYEALKQGWLVMPRKDKPDRYMIRCPDHITEYAKRRVIKVRKR